MEKSFLRKVNEVTKLAVIEREPLWRHTSFQIGGPAEVMLFPENEFQLQAILKLFGEEEIHLNFIGGGTNILAPDEMLRGAVINLKRLNKRIQVNKEERSVIAGCGVINSTLVNTLINADLGGLEFLSGIPGTLGGAVAMNAGAQEKCIGTFVKSLQVVSLIPPFDICDLEEKNLKFSYRNFKIPFPGIITNAKLCVFEQEKETIEEKIQSLLRERKKRQPLNFPSAGCIFKNSERISAGKLIEEMGFKGYQKGRAKVSELHANFIVNSGGALAKDVLFIMDRIKNLAFSRWEIELCEEVKIL